MYMNSLYRTEATQTRVSSETAIGQRYVLYAHVRDEQIYTKLKVSGLREPCGPTSSAGA